MKALVGAFNQEKALGTSPINRFAALVPDLHELHGAATRHPPPVDVKLRVAGQRRTNVLEPESGEGEGVTLHCHWSRHQRELVLQTIHQFSKLAFTFKNLLRSYAKRELTKS